jgi:hypothetical protein
MKIDIPGGGGVVPLIVGPVETVDKNYRTMSLHFKVIQKNPST